MSHTDEQEKKNDNKQSEEENQEQEEEEFYKVQSNLLKDQGNAAFQKGDIEGSIAFFSQAVDIDPDNYIVYSNRSAAYMKLNHVSKALHDAERCVELAPSWAKAYSRLGVAQQGLKRFDAAITTFKKGIELDPNSAALWSALKVCQKAYEADKKERFEKAEKERKAEEERINRMNELKKQAAAEKEKQQQEDKDSLLDDFFNDIGTSSSEAKIEEKEEEKKTKEQVDEEDNILASFFLEVNQNKKEEPVEKKKQSNINDGEEEDENGNNEAEEDKESLLTEKYVNQHLGTGKEIYERLVGNNLFHWRNLNPYFVFDLDIDATKEDIKFRYKKLSLKVHPDRLRNIDNPNAAFEQVKEAYEKLSNEETKKTIVLHIENVTHDLLKERKKLLQTKTVRFFFGFFPCFLPVVCALFLCRSLSYPRLKKKERKD
jgi:tetratricopeptide (TPR) repeat protein